MSALANLEKDVHMFLSNLPYVRRVDVKGAMVRGKKNVCATTYLWPDDLTSRSTVQRVEQALLSRHKNVKFKFELKAGHGPETLATD